MSSALTLGSLFDGSGGFPLAALNVAIRPVWASEVEPFPILVTRTRLPEVQHLGDVSLINGAEVAPVDIVTFGSPWQDLSIASRQAGLGGERSGLFFEAIRIIRQMREATHGRYPRYAIWENVPGAFSSNHGHDFSAVLTSLLEVGQEKEEARLFDVPVPDTGWVDAGAVVAGGCSVAWRVLDAQYFGLAQRRRRIYLVCDFASRGAGEILFEPQGSCRDLEPCRAEEQKHAPTTEGSTSRSGEGLAAIAVEHHPQDSRVKLKADGVVQTLTARMGNSPTNVPILLENTECSRRVFGLNSIHESRPTGGSYGYEARVSKTLDVRGGEPCCNQGGMVVLEPVYAASKSDFFTRATANQAGALLASDYTAPPLVAGAKFRPRRLTPTECARLQGFPDNWCENLQVTDPSEEELVFWEQVWGRWNELRGVKPRSRNQIRTWLASPGGDRAEYKLWGNGIALPVAEYVLGRLAEIARTTG